MSKASLQVKSHSEVFSTTANLPNSSAHMNIQRMNSTPDKLSPIAMIRQPKSTNLEADQAFSPLLKSKKRTENDGFGHSTSLASNKSNAS